MRTVALFRGAKGDHDAFGTIQQPLGQNFDIARRRTPPLRRHSADEITLDGWAEQAS